MNDSFNPTFEASNSLSNNELSFIALCNEYCSALEHVSLTSTSELVDSMLRLLPRLYITASDLKTDLVSEGGFIAQSLTEETYNQVREKIAAVMGEDDAFLEVAVEEMKYSDTPIGMTVSESLADLYQVFFDFLETCRDAPTDLIKEALTCVRESFADFWSQTLANVFRALNVVKFS